MKRNLFLSIMALLVAGCSNSTSNYVYEAKPTDPKLEFIADFGGDAVLPVHYALNIEKPNSNQCVDFTEVSYYYPGKSIFVLANKNEELLAQVPANQPVSIKGRYSVGGESPCSAPIQQFKAEEGKEYLVSFKYKDSVCNIEVTDKNTSEKVKTVVKAKRCIP